MDQTQPQSCACPDWEAFLAGLGLAPATLDAIRAVLTTAEPFEPEAFGFLRANSMTWIKRHPVTHRVILNLRRIQLDPAGPVLWSLWHYDPDRENLYEGDIPSRAFAAVLFAGLAMACSPEEEEDADLRACLVGSKPE